MTVQAAQALQATNRISVVHPERATLVAAQFLRLHGQHVDAELIDDDQLVTVPVEHVELPVSVNLHDDAD